MNHCFIITSAINTRFGVFNSAKRLLDTLATIGSIRAQVHDAKIVILEMAAIPLTEDQTTILSSESDVLLDFTDEDSVKLMYASTDNWDIVKNGTEIQVFGAALKLLREDGELDGIDRIHKISGRYVINNQFQADVYDNLDVRNKIVLAERRPSQFSEALVGLQYQYMSRLWSWPAALTDTVIEFYDAALANFTATIAVGKYIDIEHSLFKLLPPGDIYELATIGIEGMIGPNGQSVKD